MAGLAAASLLVTGVVLLSVSSWDSIGITGRDGTAARPPRRPEAAPAVATAPVSASPGATRPGARGVPVAGATLSPDGAAATRAVKVLRAGPPLERRPVTVEVPYDVRLGTLNVLGSNHTAHSSQWAPGAARSRRQAQVIRERGIDVVGLQEVQLDQLRALRSSLPGYSVWPGDSLGRRGFQLQIAWRSDRFRLVDTGTITTVFSHQMRALPWVRLRSVATGGELYFVTLHNSPRDLERERDAATGPEIALLHSLLASGLPVLVVGDTNEKSEFFCRVAPATGMRALNGASAQGGCTVPRDAGIDWVLGGNVTDFSGYVRQRLPGATDHPIVYGDVTLTVTRKVDPATGEIVD